MNNPYDSYLMRKNKPEFLGFYCGQPVYEGDDALSEKLREAKELMERYESQLKANEICNSMVVTGGESDESFNLKIVLGLMFVFFVLLVAL